MRPFPSKSCCDCCKASLARKEVTEYLTNVFLHSWTTAELQLSTGKVCLNTNIHSFHSDHTTGATYDAIEGQFRKIRKGAKELKARVESGEIPSAPPRGAKSHPTTPRKLLATPKDRTATGRVSKSSNATPTKKNGASSIYDSQSQLESASEEVADWTVGLDAAFGRGGAGGTRGGVEGGEFDFGYGQLEMEEGV